MKVWLNDLKEGNIFYFPSTIFCEALKCEHLGDAHNMNFKMPRIKYKILEGCNDEIKTFFENNDNELFVNQYVYTDYKEAKEVVFEKLRIELESIESSIITHKKSIITLEERAEELRKALNG